MGGYAQYDWDENKITLIGMFLGNGTQDECKENLSKLKGAFADFTLDEKEQRKVAEGVLNGLFSHKSGYQRKDRPSDVGKQLIHITIVEVHIINKFDYEQSDVKCKSTFKSSELSIIAK